jgi:hypothetical protein
MCAAYCVLESLASALTLAGREITKLAAGREEALVNCCASALKEAREAAARIRPYAGEGQ